MDEIEDYDGEVLPADFCHVCGGSEIANCDRWRFKIGEGENQFDAWICRECHSRFDSPKHLEKFLSNFVRFGIYRAAERIQRLILLEAPDDIVASEVFGPIMGALFLDDQSGGSGKMRRQAIKLIREKYRRVKERFGPKTGEDRT